MGFKMKLVDDWRDAWRWFSVHCFTAVAGLTGSWAALPPEMKAAIPAQYIAIAAALICVLGVLGRVADQGNPIPPEAQAYNPPVPVMPGVPAIPSLAPQVTVATTTTVTDPIPAEDLPPPPHI